MKVTHLGDDHLVCLSSDEVALLVDICHAALISGHLSAHRDSRLRLRGFMAEVQLSLFDTAQTVWQSKRNRAHLD